jgi:hypothetical protein
LGASYAASAASHKGIRRRRFGVKTPVEPRFALILDPRARRIRPGARLAHARSSA